MSFVSPARRTSCFTLLFAKTRHGRLNGNGSEQCVVVSSSKLLALLWQAVALRAKEQ